MIKHLIALKKILLRLIQRVNSNNSSPLFEIADFNKLKQAPEVFRLYPDVLKALNMSDTSFIIFYSTLIKDIEAGNTIVYSIINKTDRIVAGFVFFEKVCPFVIAMRIIIDPCVGDLMPLKNPLKKTLKLLFKTDNTDRIVFSEINNEKELNLLKKIGFRFRGKINRCMTFSMINT